MEGFLKKATNFIHGFVRLIMGFIALILFYLGIKIILTGDNNNAALAAVAIAGGGFCLVFFFLSQFKRFKGFGIEAESWEREMEDAARITKNFQNLAKIVAQPSITALMRMGRWDSGISRREAYDLVKRFEEILRAAEASDEEIDIAKRDYLKYTIFDMIRPIHSSLKKKLDEKVNEYEKTIGNIPQPITDIETYNRFVQEKRDAAKARDEALDIFSFEYFSHTAKIIKEKINGCSLLSTQEARELISSNKEILEDLIYFESNQEIRRPDVWFSGESENET